MPTYEYECQECKFRFDVFQNMKDDPITECKKCKGKVKRLIGAGAGIIFKGSGFYVTDYKKSSSATNGAKNGAKNNDVSKKIENSGEKKQTDSSSKSQEKEKSDDRYSG